MIIVLILVVVDYGLVQVYTIKWMSQHLGDLILVVVDYGLVPQLMLSLRICLWVLVLILVVVDYGLVRVSLRVTIIMMVVLILVVVDYGLVLTFQTTTNSKTI